MFDIGFAEILIVAIVALVVLGPEKLPTAIRTVGLWVGRIRRTVGSIQAEISQELKLDELKRTTAIKKEELDKELSDMQQPFDILGENSPIAAKTTPVEELQAQADDAQKAKDVQPVEETDKVDKS